MSVADLSVTCGSVEVPALQQVAGATTQLRDVMLASVRRCEDLNELA